jgi:Flp pilus assembly protein TadD
VAQTSTFKGRTFRTLVVAAATVVLLSACATNRASTRVATPDYSGLSQAQTETAVVQLGERYKANPRDTNAAIHFAAALRAAGQPGQAVAVMEQAMSIAGNDASVRVAYAKALAANGQFEQALNVVDGTIDPTAPDWNALSVKGAILDQMGRNEEARVLYRQAQVTAPGEASLEANLGLSFAMTNDLAQAEGHLRRAVTMPTATSQIRQNLALVVGLQGRFDEARDIYARELPADQVENNMSYIRALITQQNRWDVIKENG